MWEWFFARRRYERIRTCSVSANHLVRANRGGITNADAASVLGLRSDYGGGKKTICHTLYSAFCFVKAKSIVLNLAGATAQQERDIKFSGVIDELICQ